MANNTKIKQAARKRVFELVAATEHEITAVKPDGMSISLLEELLCCLLSLQEGDLPRFRLSEWALAGGISPQARCRMSSSESSCDEDRHQTVVEMIYGRQPATTNGDLRSTISSLLSAGRRVLVVAPTAGKLAELTAPAMASSPEASEAARTTIVTVSREGTAEFCHASLAKTDVDVIIDELSTASDDACAQLRSQRAALAKSCDEILAILTARSALAQEIAMLNLIHVRCDELTSLNKSLSIHLKELEMSIAKLQSGQVHRPTPWQIFWNHLTAAAEKESNALRTRERELAHVRRRLARSEQEADQLTLEMASRQAFITETTRQVLRRLSQYAPSFAEAVDLVGQYRKRIKEVDKSLKAWPTKRSAEDVLASARLVGITVSSLFDGRLQKARFDVVLIDSAESLPLAFMYWACSYAASALGFGIGVAKAPQSRCVSEPASFWFGRSIVNQLIADHACAIKSGWSPVVPPTAAIAEPGSGKM